MPRQDDHGIPGQGKQRNLVGFRVEAGHDHGVGAFGFAVVRLAVPVVNTQKQYVDAFVQLLIFFNGRVCCHHFLFRRVDDVGVHPHRSPEYRSQQYRQHHQQ